MFKPKMIAPHKPVPSFMFPTPTLIPSLVN